MRKTCLDGVYELARRDDRVVFVGSDLGPGTLADMLDEMPDRFFMEGVCEQNVMGIAAGLAMDGLIPFVNTIATFITRRAYEQVAMDVCLPNLPVRLIGNGGGVVYAPLGPSHLALDDIALMRALPNMTVVAPTDADEMRRFMPETLSWPGPMYIRLGKGGDPMVSGADKVVSISNAGDGGADDGFAVGGSYLLRPPGDVLFVTTGVMASRALDASNILAEQGIRCGVLHMPTIKPLDEEGLFEMAAGARLLVSVEEHFLAGGFGGAVLEAMVDRGPGGLPRMLRLGMPDAFPSEYGSQDSILETANLHPAGLASSVKRALN
jgi:transketolase